jgi:ABC-type sugar transport system ATPase subunit
LLQAGTIGEIYARPANMFVGKLVGSPAMAFLDAHMDGDAIRIAGNGQRISLADFGGLGNRPQQAVLVGAWPEDIDMVSLGTNDSSEGHIYAVDNRGFERAVQINGAFGAFRKVLPHGVEMKQNEACAFRIRAGAAFLFDAASGNRISQTHGEDRK